MPVTMPVTMPVIMPVTMPVTMPVIMPVIMPVLCRAPGIRAVPLAHVLLLPSTQLLQPGRPPDPPRQAG